MPRGCALIERKDGEEEASEEPSNLGYVLYVIMVSFAKLVIFKGFGRASGLELLYALSTLILLLA